jgi:myo-inositol-1(or 4)-monophosphatase
MALPPPAKLLEAAVEAARLGANELTAAFGASLEVRAKAHYRDLVTQADTASERAILATLGDQWPEIGLLAEEAGRTRPGREATWVIDPLDGTFNFAHGYPVFSVSIACVDRAGALAGVVYDPLREELFTATRGGGAYLNGRAIRVSAVEHLEGALFTTGFPYYPPERRRRAGEVFTDVMVIAAAARRGGSAALDLAYVASGRSEAHYELHLSPHDVAAATLMVAEAGGYVQALAQVGDRGWPLGIVATNGAALHGELVSIVAAGFELRPEPFSFSSLFAAAEE